MPPNILSGESSGGKHFKLVLEVTPPNVHVVPKVLGLHLFFLLYAAWVRSRAERPSVSYTKVVMEVAWTGRKVLGLHLSLFTLQGFGTHRDKRGMPSG